VWKCFLTKRTKQREIHNYQHLSSSESQHSCSILWRSHKVRKLKSAFLLGITMPIIFWNCSNTDRAGRLVLASIENHYACILNDQRSMLLLPSNSGLLVIDLTIATANMAPLCEVLRKTTRVAIATSSKLAPIWSYVNGMLIRLILILKSWLISRIWLVHTIRLSTIYYLMKMRHTLDWRIIWWTRP